MRIGIIGAMHEEIKSLKNDMVIEREENIAGIKYFIGKILNKDIILVESGIGKVNSAICTTILIQKFDVKKIIFTGVAGAVSKELNIGDIVVGTDLVEHDFDCSAFGMSPGTIPRMDNSNFESDKNLFELAKKSAIKVMGENKIKFGRIISGDQFVADKDKIEWLGKTFGAMCTEMEGASVAHTCHLFKIPFVIIRAISDKADGSAHVDFKEFVNIAAENSKKIVEDILKNI
ncbi:MAG: 5'-methylthioadenosine/adenosylhomocysteine nucleosidase [Fusobacteriaceae bacterium]